MTLCTSPTPSPTLGALEYVLDATHFAGALAEAIASALERGALSAGVAWQAVVGPRSLSAIRRARHAVAAALFAIDVGEGRHLSLDEIGLVMGGKDHTTVRYYLDRVRRGAP